MPEEQIYDLKSVLRDNLDISMTTWKDWSGHKLSVKITFQGETICEDYVTLEEFNDES